jgi:DNA-binding response OmpR family regulator
MKRKILIIEDELALQKTFSDILEKEGYQVISALNGESGLILAKRENPDLILLDLILPQKDGFEVLKELKKDETTKEIPVIVLTNLEDIQSVERTVELGATTYLVKAQYTLKELIQKIKDELEK